MTPEERKETLTWIKENLDKLEQNATTDFEKGVAEGFRRAESILLSAEAYNIANSGKHAEIWGDHLYEAAEMIAEGATDSFIMYKTVDNAYKEGFEEGKKVK